MDANGTVRRGVVLVVLWIVVALGLLVPVFGGDKLELSGDNAMRLLEVRDLLDGQAWYDTTQYRDNTPFGGPMHWSRLVDAPIAGLILLARPFAGALAETIAIAVWPLLLMAALVALLVPLAERLAGPASRVPMAILVAMALPIYYDFRPGTIDHHNVQAVLAVAAILATIHARRSLWGAGLAGLAGAAMLAIGTESLPIVITQLLVVPMYWVFSPHQQVRNVVLFAASLAGATTAFLLLAVPPERLFEPRCDAISMTYASGTLLYCVAVVLAAGLGRKLDTRGARFALLAVLGTVAAGLALWLSPNCLRGPYGDLDPELTRILLGPIGEAQPVWEWLFPLRPSVAILLLPLAGLGAAVLAIANTRGEEQARWIVLFVFLAAAVLVMLLQVRGTRLATIVALPAGTWAVTIAWARLRERQSLAAALGVVLAALPFLGMLHWPAGVLLFGANAERVIDPSFDEASEACSRTAAYERLAALPPGRVLNYMIIGPKILVVTPHQIVNAGYHRNTEGLRDLVRFFGGSEADALEVVQRRQLDYLVVCRGIGPEDGLAGLAPFKGLSWPWLTPLSRPDEAVQIYRIDTASS